jgi:hypothetical protein
MMSGSSCRDCGRASFGHEFCGRCVGKRLAEKWVRNVVEELLPAGHYEKGGREYRVGSTAGEPGRSLAIVIGGAKSGVWHEKASDEGGDLIKLTGRCLGGGNAEGLAWARKYLGQSERQRTARPLPVHAPDEDIKNHKFAERIWEEKALPHRRGDMVHRYFDEERGLDLEWLAQANDGKLPDVLRFVPRLWHRESGLFYPAMVAKIVGPDGQFLGIHRTWLIERGGRVEKAPLGKLAKMTLGSFAKQGGCIRLWHPRWHEATDEDTLAVSEGIEDGMSAAMLYPSWRVAAGVSLSGLLSIVIPLVFVRIVVVVQNDPPSEPGRRGAVELIEEVRARFRRQGREVQLLKVPREVKDLNDLLRTFGKLRNAGDEPLNRDVDQKIAGAAVGASSRR